MSQKWFQNKTQTFFLRRTLEFFVVSSFLNSGCTNPETSTSGGFVTKEAVTIDSTRPTLKGLVDTDSAGDILSCSVDASADDALSALVKAQGSQLTFRFYSSLNKDAPKATISATDLRATFKLPRLSDQTSEKEKIDYRGQTFECDFLVESTQGAVVTKRSNAVTIVDMPPTIQIVGNSSTFSNLVPGTSVPPTFLNVEDPDGDEVEVAVISSSCGESVTFDKNTLSIGGQLSSTGYSGGNCSISLNAIANGKTSTTPLTVEYNLVSTTQGEFPTLLLQDVPSGTSSSTALSVKVTDLTSVTKKYSYLLTASSDTCKLDSTEYSGHYPI